MKLIAVLFLGCVGIVRGLDTIHTLDPSHQMYPAVIRQLRLGVGTHPIRYEMFVLDPQFSGILLEPTKHPHCANTTVKRTYLDLGGPKPFFTQGCSPIRGMGVLGLGPQSNLWGTFSGYENRGGRIILLSEKMDPKPTQHVSRALPNREEMLVTQYSYHASSQLLTSKRSYLSRSDGIPTGVTALAVAFFLVFLRGKVVRKLVYWWQESAISLTARVLSALFQVIAYPIMLEFYEARRIMGQDIGSGLAFAVSALGYFASALVLIHVLMRLVLHFQFEVKSLEWAMRLDLLGSVAMSTGSLLGVWFATNWYAAADSGSFISAGILVFMMYEQLYVLHLSLASLASGRETMQPQLLVAWWIFVLLPVVGVGIYVTASLGIQPFLENRIPSQRIALRATVFATMFLIAYLPQKQVYEGIKETSRKLRRKGK